MNVIYAQNYTQHTYLYIVILLREDISYRLILQLTGFITPSIIQLLIHRRQLIKF